ncbi:Snf7-domain-containing protein [Mucor mucedo]|uniref:Snf7-domain-containing protein n=1 Tax=Mucor mucedo TaxID=29922 RepID=UPI00221E8544|nr:Snf7-domain-containing protein [Mucor mucedo]KAI7897422.1 Snf7-domain-containing protein [Mucor mucedo]
MATKKHSKLKDFLSASFTEFNEQNSERLKALYSDFSKLSLLNKYAYDTNVSYWRRVILDSNQQGCLGSREFATVIEKDTLPEKFQRPVIGRPLALDCVLDTMERQEELITLENFNTRFSPPATWLGWMVDAVVKNAWQFRWRNTVQHETRYVVLPTVKALSQAVLRHHYETPSADPILTLTQFKSNYSRDFFNDMELTDDDVMLLLRYLHSQHGVALANNVQGYGTTYMVIKFPSREGEVATMTQHDKSIVSIRTTCQALSVQVDELQRKSEELHKESLEEKRLGHTAKALYCLKRKKNLQQILERRLQSLETMDNILLKIQTSKDDLQVVQAFNMGADTLRDVLGSDGLTLESVDEAMQNIQSAFEDQKEIEEAMKMGDISEYADEDLEDELSQLIRESPSPASIPLPVSPPPVPDTNVNSELSRLNQMFSSVKNVPRQGPSKKEKEYA